MGGQLDLGSGWRTKAQVATAFRAPNVDDLAKIRINNEEISVPNVGLQPELALTSEITVAKVFGTSYVSATAFRTLLDDAIIRAPFSLPDGSKTIVDESDTLHVIANVNAEKARVWGISGTGRIQIGGEWALMGNINYTKGLSVDAASLEQPLAHIPPLYGRLQLDYVNGNHTAQITYRYNGAKPIEEYGGTADNPEYATPEGTSAWATWNIYYQYKASDNWSVSLGAENILNTHYRPCASGVSAAGRNLSMAVRRYF